MAILSVTLALSLGVYARVLTDQGESRQHVAALFSVNRTTLYRNLAA